MLRMRSYFAPNAKESPQEDEDFLNRKRANEDAREFYSIKIFNKNLLVQLSSLFHTERNKEEHKHCYAIIGKVNPIKDARTSDMAHDELLLRLR